MDMEEEIEMAFDLQRIQKPDSISFNKSDEYNPFVS